MFCIGKLPGLQSQRTKPLGLFRGKNCQEQLLPMAIHFHVLDSVDISLFLLAEWLFLHWLWGISRGP